MEFNGEAVITAEDLGALALLTSGWRQLNLVSQRSSDELQKLIDRLEVPGDISRSLLSILEQLRPVAVGEPGQMLAQDGDSCGLGWQPSVLAPVFYGNREIDAGASGPPMRVRVSFPSTDGSPDSAAPLVGCGRYPLVLFVHGQCQEAEHFRRWDLLASRLARGGYVVAVPEVDPSTPWNSPEVGRLEDLLLWLRSSWEFANLLLPRPATAVVGHSYGALLAGRLVTRQNHPFSAYASLSGVWRDWDSSVPLPLSNIGIASLFIWGSEPLGLAEASADLGEWWSQLELVKHRIVFKRMEHWDYLGSGGSACASFQGDCPALARDLAADFVLTFLSHYLPPEKWWLLPTTIPHSLVPPPLALTPAQKPFAGGHLAGFARTEGGGACSVTHTWEVSADAGAITLTGQ